MSVGEYEQIEKDRRRAFKLMRSLYDLEERRLNEQRFDELSARREQYLRELLARLPFRWYVAHAYTSQETATYGGADHIVVDEEVRIGRLHRRPGDALSRPRAKFLDLSRVENDRLPTSLADIKIAERLVSALIVEKKPKLKKSSAQLKREIAEVLGKR